MIPNVVPVRWGDHVFVPLLDNGEAKLPLEAIQRRVCRFRQSPKTRNRHTWLMKSLDSMDYRTVRQ